MGGRVKTGYIPICDSGDPNRYCKPNHYFYPNPNQVVFVSQPNQSISTALWHERERENVTQTNKKKLQHKEICSFNLSSFAETILTFILLIGLFSFYSCSLAMYELMVALV